MAPGLRKFWGILRLFPGGWRHHVDMAGLVRFGARSAAALLVIACSPASGLFDDGDDGGICACPPPPPPTIVTISGVLLPADSTVDIDLIELHFGSVPGDSTCTPDTRARLGILGRAVSDSGAFSGPAYGSPEGAPACFHLFASRTNRELVQLSERAVRVVFSDNTAGPYRLEGVLPAGPDDWVRWYR